MVAGKELLDHLAWHWKRFGILFVLCLEVPAQQRLLLVVKVVSVDHRLVIVFESALDLVIVLDHVVVILHLLAQLMESALLFLLRISLEQFQLLGHLPHLHVRQVVLVVLHLKLRIILNILASS